MSPCILICLKAVRWTGWLLLPLTLAFFLTGYAISGRYGLGALMTEEKALAWHKLLHAPLFLVVVALASAAALFLEHYNRPAVHWNIVRGVSLYSLAGLGYALWRRLDVMDTIQADPMMTQGATYLNAVIGIAMYVLPLGLVVLLAQSILAHPPVGRPDEILTTIRTRGKER